jgi:uncharacterized protein YxjI
MFSKSKYSLRKKFLQFLGASFEISDEQGNLVLFADQKAFKLREDIRLYTNKEKTEEILTIKARNIIDFSATYDVFDSTTGNKIGSLKRNGFKSMAQDEWFVLNNEEQETAKIIEDSLLLALVRRFVTNLIPQNYDVLMDGKRVCDLKQNFNPFIYKLEIDFSENTEGKFDTRLGICAAVLLAAIEGKQS